MIHVGFIKGFCILPTLSLHKTACRCDIKLAGTIHSQFSSHNEVTNNVDLLPRRASHYSCSTRPSFVSFQPQGIPSFYYRCQIESRMLARANVVHLRKVRPTFIISSASFTWLQIRLSLLRQYQAVTFLSSNECNHLKLRCLVLLHHCFAALRFVYLKHSYPAVNIDSPRFCNQKQAL